MNDGKGLVNSRCPDLDLPALPGLAGNRHEALLSFLKLDNCASHNLDD